jgi:hypothetical protein
MSHECKCGTIELPWEDSNCPFHGTEAQRKEKDEARNRSDVEERLIALEGQVETLATTIDMLISWNQALKSQIVTLELHTRVAKP